MVTKTLDNMGTVFQGAGSAGIGCAIGEIFIPKVGCWAGSMFGAGAGAATVKVEEKNKRPPTGGELAIQFLDTVGWWTLLLGLGGAFSFWLLGWWTPSHRESKMQKHIQEMGKKKPSEEG